MNTEILNLKKMIRAEWNSSREIDDLDTIDEIRENYDEILWVILEWNEENEYLNFEDSIYDIPKTMEKLKEIGINTFSYSCSSSGALRDFAEFEKCGFKLKGMTTIKTIKHGYKKPAVVFEAE